MADAKIKESKINDVSHFGIRLAIGAIFVAHGSGKFDPGFASFLVNIGVPTEMQVLLALAELVPGILMIVGVLTRISASILSMVMLGAIFHVKHASNLIGQGGYELDLMLLASSLVIIAVGPGRISISHIAKKIPRFLQ